MSRSAKGIEENTKIVYGVCKKAQDLLNGDIADNMTGAYLAGQLSMIMQYDLLGDRIFPDWLYAENDKLQDYYRFVINHIKEGDNRY
jgi:hypothetical protein